MGLFSRLHPRVVPTPAAEALTDRDALDVLARIAGGTLRGAWLRLWAHSSSGAVLVGRRATIRGARYLTLGRHVKIEELAELHCRSERGIVLEDRVTIGRCASIRPSSYYGHCAGEGLRIGAGSAIGALSWIGASGYVDIGRDVLTGPRVTILPENHRFDDLALPIRDQGVVREGVAIEDDCWIGAGATILAGVSVGTGSVVAAGAVVTRDVAPRSIVAGVPARTIGHRGADEPTRVAA